MNCLVSNIKYCMNGDYNNCFIQRYRDNLQFYVDKDIPLLDELKYIILFPSAISLLHLKAAIKVYFSQYHNKFTTMLLLK